MLYGNEMVIHDGNWQEVVNPTVAGERKGMGLIPRDYNKYPVGCYGAAPPFWAVDVPMIPEGEWTLRVQEKESRNERMSDIRMYGLNGRPIPSRDQNGRGYCWMHSGVGGVIIDRAIRNEPYADLSAYGPACVIKNFQDEGGWGAQGLDFLFSRGCPTSKFWPQQGTDRSYDNPNTWADAALHKVVKGFVDLQAAQYDRKLSKAQVITCLLSGWPVIGDFNWWGHSVIMLDVVDGARTFGILRSASGKLMARPEFEYVWQLNTSEGLGTRIWNSWGDSWSEQGMGVLAGSRAWPDGATAICSTSASAA